MTRWDVIVVGAGFAGLSAGVRLARDGARVLVLEKRTRLGGRATAFADRDTGARVDNGQHVMLGCYTATFEFLDEIGARGNIRLQPQLAVTMVDLAGRTSRLECPLLPPPFHLLAGIFEWDALSWRDKWSTLGLAGPLRIARRYAEGPGPIAASPGETVENWLVRNGQSARIRELLWDPLALAALNQPASEAAALPFTRVLAEMFGTDPRAAAIALPVAPLDLMYAEPARQYIERHGGSVRTGAAARIDLSNGAAASVHANGETWATPVVVAAVPWFAFPELFDQPPPALAGIIRNARATASSPIVTVNVWFDRPLFDEPFVGLPGRTMQWVFDTRGAGGSHLSLVSSGAARVAALPNGDLISMAVDELLEAFPRARQARLVRAGVVREPRATFSLAPGQPERPATRTPVGGLLLAGDWIETGLPATIESAVRAGHRAADLALGNLGI